MICALPNDCLQPLQSFQFLWEDILLRICFGPASPNALIEESLPKPWMTEFNHRDVSRLFAAKIQARGGVDRLLVADEADTGPDEDCDVVDPVPDATPEAVHPPADHHLEFAVLGIFQQLRQHRASGAHLGGGLFQVNKDQPSLPFGEAA